MMTDKKKNTRQRERFEQAARELGVELDEEKLKETLRGFARKRPEPEGNVNTGVTESQD